MLPEQAPSRMHGWLLAWLAVAIVWLAHAATDFLLPAQRWWTDHVVATQPRQLSSEVAVVAIDEASLARLGRWPWSRDLHARLIDRLTEVGARVVVHTVPFPGAEGEDALSQLHRIAATVAADPSLAEHPRLPGLLAQSQDLLDADGRLERSLAQNGRTLLAIDASVDARARSGWPLASLSAVAAGVGPVALPVDDDGVLRRVVLLPQVEGKRLPVLGAWAVALARGQGSASISWRAAQPTATVADRRLPVDRQGALQPMWSPLSAPGTTFNHVSAADLLRNSGPDARLAGRIVFVGPTVGGPTLALADGSVLSLVEAQAQLASALLTGQVLRLPVEAPLVEAGLVLLVALYLVLAVPRLGAAAGVLVSACLGALLLAGGYLGLSLARVEWPIACPVAALLAGQLAALGWRLLLPGRAESGAAQASALDSVGPRTRGLAPLTLSPALPQLGRFQILRELARGAMGRLYVAHELDTLRPVALKTLALSREFKGAALADARDRFRREILAASRLHHPDIVRVIDAGEDQGLAYLAMELLSGDNLVRHTRPGDLLPVPVVLEIAARVAEALHHAHGLGVIHRDIKPANIMIDLARGQVKITDFGVARVVDAARTRTGVVLGSPSYMSPEQLIGREVDGRSDLYSLGVVLFQLLTGELPAQGNTLASLIESVVNQPAPDVRTLRPRLPEAVANIVALALEKRPELRYADCAQLGADLRAVAALWRQATGASPRALEGAWSSPSEFIEAVDLVAETAVAS